MSSIRKLLQGAAVYSISNALNAVIPFLLMPILTRVLIPSEYGIIAMYSATLSFLGAFTGLSTHGAISVRFVDRDKVDMTSFIWSCFFVLGICTLSTYSFVFIFRDMLVDITGIPSFWLLNAVLVSGCSFIVQFRLVIWMMEKKSIAYGSYLVIFCLLDMVTSLVLVLIFRHGYEGRLLGQFSVGLLSAFCAYSSLRAGGWIRFKLKVEYIREALAFGIPLIPHVVGALLISLADRFVINQQLGLASAGTYMVAAQLGMGMALLADAFNTAFVPWLFEHLKANDSVTNRQVVLVTWCYFVAILCLAGILALMSHWLISLVAGQAYRGAAVVLPWIALGQAFFGMYLMVTNYIFYKRKTAVLAWVTLFAGGIGVGLLFVLVPLFGVAGAGISFVSAMILRFMMTWILANRVCPMPWFYWCKV